MVQEISKEHFFGKGNFFWIFTKRKVLPILIQTAVVLHGSQWKTVGYAKALLVMKMILDARFPSRINSISEGCDFFWITFYYYQFILSMTINILRVVLNSESSNLIL